MYKFKLIAFYFLSCVAVFTFSGCQKDVFTNQEIKPQASPSISDQASKGIGQSKAPGGQNVPYPAIIKKTFIPTNPLFAHTKCLTWQITWPTYPVGTDPEKIATVFTTSTGALNSINYLNNTDPQNTLSADFSLYHNNKLEAAVMMWEELDYNELTMESVFFYKTPYTLKEVQTWVKERPELFKLFWKSSVLMEVSYQAGDIYLFKLPSKELYGGIRILSMNPRKIEVYLAVPNN